MTSPLPSQRRQHSSRLAFQRPRRRPAFPLKLLHVRREAEYHGSTTTDKHLSGVWAAGSSHPQQIIATSHVNAGAAPRRLLNINGRGYQPIPYNYLTHLRKRNVKTQTTARQTNISSDGRTSQPALDNLFLSAHSSIHDAFKKFLRISSSDVLDNHYENDNFR